MIFIERKVIHTIEYMCRNCGAKNARGVNSGKPQPGRCPRKNGKPHSWIVNKRF